MTRKPKSAAKRHDTVVSLKVSTPTRRQLVRLAEKAGLRLSAYSARVLEAHVDDPKPVTPIAEDLRAAKNKLFFAGVPAELFPKAVLDRVEAATGEHNLSLVGELVEAAKPCVIEMRVAFLGAIDKYERSVFWHEQASGMPRIGDHYDAFEAAWIARDFKLAEDIARRATTEGSP